MDTSAKRLHRARIGDVQRRERCGPTFGLDPVVKLFERADGLAHRDDVIRGRKRLGQSGTKAARCAAAPFGG